MTPPDTATDGDEEKEAKAREISPCPCCHGDPRGVWRRTESWFGAQVTYGGEWSRCVVCDGKGMTIMAKKIAKALAEAEAEGRRRGSLDPLQAEIGAWGDAAFPNSTQATVLAHLRAEVNEEVAVDCDPEELADAAMLVIQLAHKRGLSLDALLRAKLTKNKARKWKFDPARGFSVHVPDGAKCRTCGGTGEVHAVGDPRIPCGTPEHWQKCPACAGGGR